MKRILIATLALLVLAVCLTADAGAVSQARAKLRGFSCQRSLKPIGRGIAATGVMRPVRATQRMSLKFDLLTRTKAAPSWALVAGNGLSNWISPANPTLGQRSADVWIVNKSVNDLAAPAEYQLRATFRWFGPHQRLLATATRLSSICVQPELRPDLLVQSVQVQPVPGRPKLNSYTVTIANHGATAAPGFRVQFAPGGGESPKYEFVSHLAAHDTTTLQPFLGPACTSTSASTVTADPDGEVDDFDRSNNTVTVDCGSPAGTQ